VKPALLLWLNDDARRRLAEAAAAAHPHEACGILAGGNVVVLRNVAPAATAHESFETDPAEVRAAVEAAGGWGAVEAVWHSHPDSVDGMVEGRPYPSELDRQAHPVGPVLIVVTGGEAYGWQHDTP
jgi:proteasome lid subunit RPN8/RPN11